MIRIFRVLITSILLAAMILPAGLVFAAPKPTGAVQVLNITYKVTNDEDSGLNGYWALDNYNKTIQVWLQTDGIYYAVVGYIGKFNTVAGATSPGALAIKEGTGTGALKGSYTATFTADGLKAGLKNGNIGTFDFGGTAQDVLANGGNVNAYSWLGTYFTGADNFNYIDWTWTYKYQSQTWVNSSSGNTGDVVIP